MKSVLKLLQHLLLFPLSYLFPRKQTLWAFGAPDGTFEGNAKFLFLWVSAQAPDIYPIWISPNAALVGHLRREGFNAARRLSGEGLVYALRAKFFFVNSNGDDVNFPLSGGASVFNLWHGVGIKNILRKSTVGKNSKIFKSRWFLPLFIRSLQRFKRPRYVLSTSPMMSQHFADCFGIDPARCIECGYPRQDPAFDPALRRTAAGLEADQSLRRLRLSFDKVFVYAPTLRQNATDLIADAFPAMSQLSDALRSQNALLLIKLHPRDKSSVSALCAPYSNIEAWPADTDFYTHMAELDCLITDYSSLLYDWIDAKSSGLIVYPFDYKRFITEERDLAFPYEDNIVGARANNFGELCDLIQSAAPFHPLPENEVQQLRTKFWGQAPRRPACRNVVEFVRRQT